MTVEWNGDAIIAKIREAAMRGVIRGTEDVLAEGNSLILDGQKTGRVYRRRGVTHQASAPGEAPASDTGRLVQSGRTEYQPADLTGEVIWSTDYAEDLEFGSENVEPRPFARPALANCADRTAKNIATEIARALIGETQRSPPR